MSTFFRNVSHQAIFIFFLSSSSTTHISFLLVCSAWTTRLCWLPSFKDSKRIYDNNTCWRRASAITDLTYCRLILVKSVFFNNPTLKLYRQYVVKNSEYDRNRNEKNVQANGLFIFFFSWSASFWMPFTWHRWRTEFWNFLKFWIENTLFRWVKRTGFFFFSSFAFVRYEKKKNKTWHNFYVVNIAISYYSVTRI